MANQGYSKLSGKEKLTIFKKIIKCKNPNTKTQHHNEYK